MSTEKQYYLIPIFDDDDFMNIFCKKASFKSLKILLRHKSMAKYYTTSIAYWNKKTNYHPAELDKFFEGLKRRTSIIEYFKALYDKDKEEFKNVLKIIRADIWTKDMVREYRKTHMGLDCFIEEWELQHYNKGGSEFKLLMSAFISRRENKYQEDMDEIKNWRKDFYEK